jgi:hypothetical protein
MVNVTVIHHIFLDISYEYLKYESEDGMHKEAQEELRVRLVVLELANHFGATKARQEFNVPRSTF